MSELSCVNDRFYSEIISGIGVKLVHYLFIYFVVVQIVQQ